MTGPAKPSASKIGMKTFVDRVIFEIVQREIGRPVGGQGDLQHMAVEQHIDIALDAEFLDFLDHMAARISSAVMRVPVVVIVV